MRSGPRIVRVRLTGRVCTGFLQCNDSAVTGKWQTNEHRGRSCRTRSVGDALRLLLLLLLLGRALGVVLGRR